MASAKRNLFAGLTGLAALTYAVSVFSSWGAVPVRVAHEVVPFLVPLAAAAVCFRVAVRGSSESRASWLLFGWGAASWAIGDILFSLLDVVFHLDPATTFTPADIGYLALIPLWGGALLLHPAKARRGLEFIGGTLDALAVFVAAAALTLAYVLIPIVAAGENVVGFIVQVIYPVADLALLAAFVSVQARSASRMRAGEVFIGMAFVIFVAGDILYARLALIDQYFTGHPVDLTWVAAFVCLMFAARAGLRGEARPEVEMAPVPVLTIVGMLAMAALTGVALVSEEHRTILLVGGVTTGLLVVGRLVTLLIERSRFGRQLDRNVRELEEAHRARERFVATISHDLRSPLTAIRGFAELLGDSDDLNSDDVKVFTDSIKRNADRLSRLTDDLLTAGQFAAGHAPSLQTETIDLRETAARALRDMGLEGRLRLGGATVWAKADEQRVEQILGNLLDNALKYSPGPEAVEVRVAATSEGAELAVSDRGSGIEPERIQAIFDPFVSDFARTTSAGLGLYVVRNLVTAMGGRVSVTSEPGHGTTFRVILPRAESELGSEHQAAPERVA